MKRVALQSFTPIVICCIFTSLFVPSLAYSSASKEIATSGTINQITQQTTKNIHLCAYRLPSPISQQAIEQLSKLDVLILQFDSGPDVRSIKLLNPNATILMYKEIMLMSPADDPADWAEVNAHEDWFLHDLNGNRLLILPWRCYAMDIGNSGWRMHYANFTNTMMKTYGFDGVLADDVWSSFRYGVWTVPQDQIPTDIGQRWHSDMFGMISFVKSYFGNRLLIVNTESNGDYVSACDGMMEEGFVHGSWHSSSEWLRGEGDVWKSYVGWLSSTSQGGKYYLAQSGTAEADTDTCHKIMLFCFTSYLLGFEGKMSSFGWSNYYTGQGYWSEYDWAKRLGQPIGNYFQHQSVYVRNFENGKVLANPSNSAYTVTFDQNLKTLDGQTISSVTLADHTGIILLKA